jgi:hypothetical protein
MIIANHADFCAQEPVVPLAASKSDILQFSLGVLIILQDFVRQPKSFVEINVSFIHHKWSVLCLKRKCFPPMLKSSKGLSKFKWPKKGCANLRGRISITPQYFFECKESDCASSVQCVIPVPPAMVLSRRRLKRLARCSVQFLRFRVASAATSSTIRRIHKGAALTLFITCIYDPQEGRNSKARYMPARHSTSQESKFLGPG